MGISNDILSSTLRIVKDQEVDNLFKSTPLLEKIREKGGVEEVDGGSTIDRALILAEHSTISQLSTGYEPVSLAVADAMRNASYNFCNAVAPVVITRVEELANKGDRAIVKIAEARLKSVMGMLKREFEKQAIAGSSTILTDMSSLCGDGTPVITTGFFENQPFGLGTNVVGGIAKGSFPLAYQNQRTDAGGTLGINDMTDLYIQCQIFSPTSAPNLILASANMYKAYKQLLFAQEFYMKETVLDGGRLALAFNGAMMYVDPFLPVAVTGATTTNLSAYFLNTDYLKLVVDKDANFELSDFEHVSGYASRSAQIMLRAQLVVDHLACQGILVNGEA